ncbi:MAG TPA: DUF302 domain-containing protein [Gammaproteobacteria bacterium]
MRSLSFLLLMLFSLCSQAVVTGEMIMVRSSEAFPETMSSLQQAISDRGYSLSRVQRVDIGLTAKGYATDKYRVVFFGKGEQVKQLAADYPQLIPYLPLKIAIYAEGDDTILISANPASFNDMFDIPQLKPVFNQWQRDIIDILNSMQSVN